MRNRHVLSSCAALALATTTLAGPPHFEGFEDASWANNTATGWNSFYSPVSRVASGTSGVASFEGGFHGLISNGSGQTGAFTRLGGYSSNFGGGFTNRLAVYMDRTAASANGGSTYGFDLSSAINNTSGVHRRDFIFHAASNAAGDILIGGSNNSGFSRRNDLASINHYTITQSGWYQFEWVFRNNGSGVLAVDLNLRDSLGNWLWTETRSDPSDLIPSMGGNRYMWFTFASTPEIHMDATQAVPEPATLLALGAGALALMRRRRNK